jgi:DNA-binding CsgD family transcriptional regulator
MIVATKTLSVDDRKVVSGVRHGMTYKEIAYELGVKEQTVKNKLYAIRKYYKCLNNAQLLVHLIDTGVI